ncbi:unnamed protein product [Schistosoma rodhaini]|uniref:SCP domain-containing protein n=1 Tax=Schistosoma rodhaini TaxID=6188 RepID=A0A183QTE8_9TREM|nr:unnamed protein product [Schistosoma rodhaini]
MIMMMIRLNVFHYFVFLIVKQYVLVKCQMITKEQLNFIGILHHKLKDDHDDSKGFEQSSLKHKEQLKRDNTLQQYVERNVKQCDPSITLPNQYFNNTPSANISENRDIKSIFKVWSAKYDHYNCIAHDCSSYKQLMAYNTRNIACSIGNCKRQTNSSNIILCYYSPLANADNRPDEIYENEPNKNFYTVTTEVPPETTSYVLEHGRCECIC